MQHIPSSESKGASQTNPNNHNEPPSWVNKQLNKVNNAITGFFSSRTRNNPDTSPVYVLEFDHSASPTLLSQPPSNFTETTLENVLKRKKHKPIKVKNHSPKFLSQKQQRIHPENKNFEKQIQEHGTVQIGNSEKPSQIQRSLSRQPRPQLIRMSQMTKTNSETLSKNVESGNLTKPLENALHSFLTDPDKQTYERGGKIVEILHKYQEKSKTDYVGHDIDLKLVRQFSEKFKEIKTEFEKKEKL